MFVCLYNGENDVSTKYGEYLYDNLILLAPAAEVFGGIDLDSIIDFVDEGHNIFVAGATETCRSTTHL